MKTILALLLILLAGCTAAPEHAVHKQERGNAGDYAVLLHTVPDTPVPGKETTLHVTPSRKDGAPITFDIIHTKPVHVMLIRDDLQHFTHLHADAPAQAYAFAHTFPEAGTYRVMVEFSEHGKTAAVPLDIVVAGDYEPVPLAASSREYRVGNYVLIMDAPLEFRAKTSIRIAFVISRDARTVTDLDDFLGEKMHLVVWQEGLKHFEHAHPAEGQDIAFVVTFPEPGTYKLIGQFQHKGTVQTGEFVVNVI